MSKAILSKTAYYGSFTPTSIAGCAMWLDAADSSSFTFSSGTTISQWNDKSGSANNFTVTTGTTTLITDGGVNVVNFPSGGSTMTSSSSITLTTNHSVFIVTKLISNTFGFGYLLSCPALKPSDNAQGVSGDYSIRYNTSLITPSTGNGGDIFYNNTGGYYANGTLSGVPTATSYHMLNGRFSQGGTTQIALSFGGVYGRYFVGTVAEVILFSQVLTTAQRQQIEGYLAWKWGLQTSLPKSLAPALTNPTSISGCVVWLDATDPAGTGVQPANGTTLTTWKDKSVSNFPFTSVGSAYNKTAVNGLPGMTLSTNFIGYDPGSAQNNWQEVFAIGLWTGGSTFNSYNGFVTTSVNSDGGAQGGILFIGNAGSTSWWGPGNTYVQQIINGTQTGSAFPAIQTPFIARTYSDTALNLQGLRFGIDRSFTDRIWIGYISEVICYNRALTSTQRQQIEGYLAWKWGSQASLVNTHPYYSAIPIHPYSTAAPIGAFLRPALSVALAPTPVTTISKTSYYGSFTPTSIAGCQIWLDGGDPAGTGVAPANGSTVSTWVDKSGNGYNGTATNTSTYSSRGILFNSSYYSTTYTANPTAETAFVVCKTTSRVTSDLIACLPNGCREFYIDNGDSILINSKGAFVITSANLYPISNVVQLLEYTYSTTAVTLYNCGASVSSVSGSYAFTGSSVTYIGGNDRGFMTGYIYEIIIYNSVLTATQRQQVEGYLAWKWGTQASLPGGHPYASAAPIGASLRPAISQALVPAGVKTAAAKSKPISYTQIFTYTGANQTFVVPANTTRLTVYMWGAGGGGGYSSAGGAGAYVQGNLTVTPGSSIIIIVGGAGITNSRVKTYGGGGGATNTGNTGGSGGGRSAIQITPGIDVVTVAGGGGGGYYGLNGTGGAGDATTGTGVNGSPSASLYGGKGGSQSAGGAKGQEDWGGNPTAGGQYYGGEGSTYAGAGGGSGFYGGGGGGGASGTAIGGGGGGGSSLTTALTSFVGYNSSDGIVSAYTGTYNSSGTYGAGAPGGNVNGTSGLVVLVYLA